MKTYCKKSKNDEKSISQFPLFFLLFVMAVCPVLGQDGPAKIVQPKDYAMWNTFRFPLITGDGKWISYKLDYEQPNDTLVVMDINGKMKYEFPKAFNGQFAPSKSPTLFAFNDTENGVGVLNMDKGTKTWNKEAQYFEFSMDGNYLASYRLDPQNGYLELLDIEKNKSLIIRSIQSFKFDPSSNSLVIIAKESNFTKVELIKLATMQRSLIVKSADSEFLYPMWNREGNGLVFMESTKELKQRLYYFENRKTPILKELDNIDIRSLGTVEISKLPLSFSDDGQRVFFSTINKMDMIGKKETDTIKVQVWKGSDKLVYPRQKSDWEFAMKDRLTAWWPKSGKLFQIANGERPRAILTGDQKFALNYNPLSYEPQFKETPQTDYFITNLETGESKLFLEKMETGLGYMKLSPNGEDIAYFKDNNWWIYNIQRNQHTNCTQNFPFPISYEHAPRTTTVTPFGCMGWTIDNELLIYDKYDIWKINSKGAPPLRITNGRKDKTYFRKCYELYGGFYTIGKAVKDEGYDLSGEVIFTTQDSLFNLGYAIRKSNGKVEPLINEPGKLSELRKAKFTNSYIFFKENNMQPRILYKMEAKKSKILAASNPQHSKFMAGKTELISFKNKEGDNLKGLLHYPDTYQQGKKYPMIVHIYEIKSPEYNIYNNPCYFNETGFNTRHFTAAGYFVLEPDILPITGNPGVSAADCVVAAVNKTSETGLINRDAIGLIGHSYGGYETAFIITQTNLFSAAVVGAGVFDLVSLAHGVNTENGKMGFEDIEGGQWKMGKSYYEDKENYRKNSSLENAHKIKTPTLIWTGSKDFRVDWHQSLEMFMSLKRLEAEVELLVYENEIHVLTKKENQQDLLERIEKWFSKYLIRK